MSEQNVELLHQAIDAFNRRELDAYLALHDSSVEFTPYERAIEGVGPYCGHDGVRTWWKEALEALPDLNSELYEVRTLGEFTVGRGRLRGTGAGSGASFDRQLWLVNQWRDGKVVWWYAFESEAQALQAVGLRE